NMRHRGHLGHEGGLRYGLCCVRASAVSYSYTAPFLLEADMRALCWHGKHDIRYDTIPDPVIEHPRDAIVKITACAICGSDLHLFDGFMPGMKHGDVMGHEFMGTVVEVGKDNSRLKVGDRVVVPFTIY